MTSVRGGHLGPFGMYVGFLSWRILPCVEFYWRRRRLVHLCGWNLKRSSTTWPVK